MRKILFLVSLLALTCSLCFANITNDGGVAYTPVTKTYKNKGRTTVSGEIVWQPASGNKIVLMGVEFSSEDKAEFVLETDVVRIDTRSMSDTDVIPNTYCAASGLIVVGNGTPIWKGAVDDILYLGTWDGAAATSGRNPNSLLLWGYETGN